MGSIRIVRPGLLTTVQDLGRWGYQSLGVPVAGAMDTLAHRVANLMVHNDASAATLEVTLSGPELSFDDQRTVAVAGAAFELSVDGRVVSGAGSFVVPANGVLRFGERVSGTRGYLAVAGGIDTPIVLGSRSTYRPARLGGHDGRALIAGDQLPLGLAKAVPARAALAPLPHVHAVGDRVIRVLAMPQDHDEAGFASDAIAMLQSGSYMIGPDSDRMGLRLSGPTLRRARKDETISDATPAGTLQVPPSGQPILLMADRQTTGGYAKLATVISADLPSVAQAATGESLVFVLCTQAEALAALIAQEQALLAFEAA
jgi:antagonist of KipI